MKTIKPNCGPYVVSWCINEHQIYPTKKEFQLWEDACKAMRHLLIDGCVNVSIKFC